MGWGGLVYDEHTRTDDNDSIVAVKPNENATDAVELSMDTPEEDVLEVTYNPAVNMTTPLDIPVPDEEEGGPFEK